jgi:hypothetical protein
MADTPNEPEIYKHVSPKTAAFLRQAAEHRKHEEVAQDSTSENMSTEQTLVPLSQSFMLHRAQLS